VYPVSAVLANDHIMNVIKPGQHGSTFGNQLLLLFTITALEVVKREEGWHKCSLLRRSFAEPDLMSCRNPLITLVRGKD
jgi:ornithine--oxo-acid transaminase